MVSRCQHIKSTKEQVLGMDLILALPFDMWNQNSFEKIGEQLLEWLKIDDRLKVIASFFAVRIRVKQNGISAIPSIFTSKTKNLGSGSSWSHSSTKWKPGMIELFNPSYCRTADADVRNTKLESEVKFRMKRSQKDPHQSPSNCSQKRKKKNCSWKRRRPLFCSALLFEHLFVDSLLESQITQEDFGIMDRKEIDKGEGWEEAQDHLRMKIRGRRKNRILLRAK